MKKIIGKVTEEEKNQIQTLFERKNALIELAKVLSADNDSLYEKLLKDMSETNSKFQDWWKFTADKYAWQSEENGHWEIDFETCDIYLICQEVTAL